MAYNVVLSQEVIEAFGITKIHKHISSGQRQVYIVDAGERKAVVKVMSAIAIDRLPRELDVYRRFADTPGLPVLIDIQQIGGRIVLLEEFIPGNNLQEIVGAYVGDGDKVKKLLTSLFKILIPVWDAKLVHRDIKPDNIIIGPDGEPTLIDFGIVKDFNAVTVTDAGQQPYSPLYGAPEQYEGQKDFISHRTDLFSLGVLGYHLYYGSLPFGNTRDDIALRFQDLNTPVFIPKECPIYDFLTECLHLSSLERPRKPSTLVPYLA